jgi:xanthine dehydrogenase molybdopterin-binding subunit B
VSGRDVVLLMALLVACSGIAGIVGVVATRSVPRTSDDAPVRHDEDPAAFRRAFIQSLVPVPIVVLLLLWLAFG